MDKQKRQAKIYFLSFLFGALHRQVGWISLQVKRTNISDAKTQCQCPSPRDKLTSPSQRLAIAYQLLRVCFWGMVRGWPSFNHRFPFLYIL